MKEIIKNKDINIGNIFIELEQTYNKYDRAFLYHVVWPAYKEVVKSKGLLSIYLYDDLQVRVYLRKHKFRYQQEWGDGEKKEGFPFPDYVLTYEYTDVVGLTRFSDDCMLNLGDRQFDLFFTLKLLQTDIMEAQAFFDYHFMESFSSDTQSYTSFLKNITYKYNNILAEGYKLKAQDYIEQLLKAPISDVKPEEVANINVPGFTLNRQTLILYYIFKALGVTRNTASITSMAFLIQGLTGRQTGAKDIKNTEIYKRLANPLVNNTKGGFVQDLRFIRDQFELVSLLEIAEEIRKEMEEER